MNKGSDCYRRFLAGDSTAFDEMIREYRARLIFFIDRYTKDTAAAEDIAIDVFTYILLHPRKYNGKTALSTYLFMLARSRAIDYIRYKNARREVELSDAMSTPAADDPFDTLLKNERKKLLNDALSSLPEEMQAAVHLTFFEGFSYKEAAAVMKKTPKQVDNLLYRAKTLLKQKLEREVDLLL